MSVVEPRPASTVVVVRGLPDRPEGFEVLLVRRNDKVAFMAGAHVFPGGRVDPGDAVADPSAGCDGVATLGRFQDLPAAHEIAYRVAAARELLEEAGLLLARAVDGSQVSPETVAQVRSRLVAGETLVTALEAHGLCLALDAFVALAHWVTPDVEPRRYDTRFFLARVPDGQTALYDASETTELRWMRPSDAIADCRRGDILLPPPTWTTLRQMALRASLDDLFAWAGSKPIVRVQPRLLRDERQTVLTLPGDPSMPAPPGWDVPEDTKFVLEEGRGWRPARAS